MPARYEGMRDKFEAQGLSEADAKTKAAKIFNATRKRGEAPVTGNAESAPPKSNKLGDQFGA